MPHVAFTKHMAHRTPAPAELVAFAHENGWTVSEFLPDRFDACASTHNAGYDVIVTRNASTGMWGWVADPGRNWGRGHKRGTARSLTAAARAAFAAVNAETSRLI